VNTELFCLSLEAFAPGYPALAVACRPRPSTGPFFAFPCCNIPCVKPFELLSRALSPDGTVLKLVRRGDEYIILADDKTLMSSRMHGSEEALANFACRQARTMGKSRNVYWMGRGLKSRADLGRWRGKFFVSA